MSLDRRGSWLALDACLHEAAAVHCLQHPQHGAGAVSLSETCSEGQPKCFGCCAQVGRPSEEEVRRMQLVAVACFSLAAKMNEVCIPSLDEVQVGHDCGLSTWGSEFCRVQCVLMH